MVCLLRVCNAQQQWLTLHPTAPLLQAWDTQAGERYTVILPEGYDPKTRTYAEAPARGPGRDIPEAYCTSTLTLPKTAPTAKGKHAAIGFPKQPASTAGVWDRLQTRLGTTPAGAAGDGSGACSSEEPQQQRYSWQATPKAPPAQLSASMQARLGSRTVGGVPVAQALSMSLEDLAAASKGPGTAKSLPQGKQKQQQRGKRGKNKDAL